MKYWQFLVKLIKRLETEENSLQQLLKALPNKPFGPTSIFASHLTIALKEIREAKAYAEAEIRKFQSFNQEVEVKDENL